MFETTFAKLRDFIDAVAPSPELLAAREAVALQAACCSLLMEVARLDAAGAERKQQAVALAMRENFAIPSEELEAMMTRLGRPENRLTSYFKPVSLINKGYAIEEKARFIEQLWNVALADGKIDMYEEQLVRTLAGLLYVSHSDFILAKHRVLESAV